MVKADAEWQAPLTPEQCVVTRKKGAERALAGANRDRHENGVWRRVCCGKDLFLPDDTYDPGTGRPSFCQPVAPESVRTRPDRRSSMNSAAFEFARTP